MPRKRKKVEYNKRLDQFLIDLQIEQDKKKKILEYVEELTFETLKEKNPKPKLRLEKLGNSS